MSLNLPSRVEKTATPEEEFAGFDYTFGGEKIRKAASGGAGTTERLYLGGAEFVDGEAESFYHPEGRVVFDNTIRFQYKLTDHLGNTVVLFEDKNGDGEIFENADPELSEVLQRQYYYPFGMQMEGLWNGQTAPGMRYLYNGKELEEDLGLNWYAYGFRYYDAAIGRFTGVDPIADQFPWVSTFNYAENMVPMAIDLWGLQAWINKTAHYSDGSTSQEWVFDESKEPRQGVYTENLYFDSECNLTGGSSGTASYSDYPNEFPNQGNYSRADGKGLITLDWEGGITYGHAALQIGKSGFNMQGGGYLLGGSYNSSEGGSGYLLETNNMNLVAEVSFMGLGANYTNQFSPTDGLAENGSLSVVTPLPGLKKSEPLNLSGGIGTNNSSVFLGGEANVGFGIGFKLKAGISVNMQPRLTEFEKKEMESIR